MKFISKPSEELYGEIKVPGDKSISHRSLICSAIAEGISKITNLQESEDVLHTLKALNQLGIKIFKDKESYVVEGKGFKGLLKSKNQLYFGNSGTGIRLMSGLLAIQDFSSSLAGDESLAKRPMKRIIEPLLEMGAKISGSSENTLPLNIDKADAVKGIDYKMPVASAQVKSAILFAALGAEGDTKIIEKSVSRDHTEKMFEFFGANISYSTKETTLSHTERFLPQEVKVPGDFSSSAFFIIAALISKSSKVTLKEVGINSSRIALLDKLMEMGAKIEPVADIIIQNSSLTGCEVLPKEVPNLIDELPILFIASSYAEGISRFNGIEELRHKESDRLKAMQIGLDSMKIKNFFDGETFCIEGRGKNYRPVGFKAQTFFDHRIAMSFAVAGINSESFIEIDSPECINTSFPEFINLGKQLGCNFETS